MSLNKLIYHQIRYWVFLLVCICTFSINTYAQCDSLSTVLSSKIKARTFTKWTSSLVHVKGQEYELLITMEVVEQALVKGLYAYGIWLYTDDFIIDTSVYNEELNDAFYLSFASEETGNLPEEGQQISKKITLIRRDKRANEVFIVGTTKALIDLLKEKEIRCTCWLYDLYSFSKKIDSGLPTISIKEALPWDRELSRSENYPIIKCFTEND